MDAHDRGPDMREERRSITVIFADLVGSTALAETLDEAEVKLVIGEAVARIVGEVERLGGYVKDLAGDGVLAFFGAPVAREDDAERALLAALGVLDSLKAYAVEVERGWGIADLAVRVGIATGPVVTGALGAGERVEFAAFGDIVNTAARIEAAAAPGSILVDDVTQRIAGAAFSWEDGVVLGLAGKTAPVKAHGLIGAIARPGQRRGIEGLDTPLIGRTAEAAALRSALDGIDAGIGGFVAVIGDAGIGKSRLITEARADYGGLWLQGRCVSYGGALPYWPFRDLVRDWLDVATDDPELRVRVRLRRKVEDLFEQESASIYPYLCSLLGVEPEPDARSRLADIAPEALQYRTFEVVEAWLSRLSRDAPLVIDLEDLHWADPTSIQLVERLLTLGERSPVLMIVAARDERDHPSWQVRQHAARDVPHLTTQIELTPLTGDADQELLAAIVGASTLPAEVEARVLAAAEGNPFYLEEIVRSLEDAGALTRTSDGWHFQRDVVVEVPATVERVILARLDRLAAGSRDLLTAASALGRRFSLPLLEAVLRDVDEDTPAGDGMTDDEGWAAAANPLDVALHELQRLGLIQEMRRWPEREFRFKHALITETAYRTLIPERRRKLHARAARWLEERYGGTEAEVPGLLARHWLEAGDEEKAIHHLERAGDRARAEWSLDEAVGHYQQLLPLLERRGASQDIAITLFKSAMALHQALRFGEANEAYQEAFTYWSPPAARQEAGSTLRVGMMQHATSADPARSNTVRDIQLFMALFDRLVEAWPGRMVVPSLAERWEIAPDGRRYVFHLRDDLRWSDGVALTAADFEYAIRRELAPDALAPSATIYFVLEGARAFANGEHDDPERIGVRALDDRTLEFRLESPAPYFMSVVNRPDSGPQPAHAIRAAGDGWAAIGTQVVSGAFERLEHSADGLVLRRRPDSPMPRTGSFERVEIARLTHAVGAEAYARGDLDLLNMQFDFDASLAAAVPDEVKSDPPAYLVYLTFDHAHPALRERSFRQALARSIDRDALDTLDAVAAGNHHVARGGFVPPPLQGHTPDIALAFDPDGARADLRASGVTDGVEVAFLADSHSTDPIAAVVAGWEDVLGLRFPVRHFEPDEWDEARATSPIVEGGWFPGYPDPEYYLRLLLHSDAADMSGGYASERFDALVDQARAEADGRQRLEYFHEADRVATREDVAGLPLFYVGNTIYVRPPVRGWWEYGKTWSSFADLRNEP